MSATEYLSGTQFTEPIRASEARGNSRAVSHEEYQDLAGRGKAHLDSLAASSRPTTGLDKHWDEIKSSAYEATREPWGGVTVHARSGKAVNPRRGYAIAARQPGQEQITVPGSASPEEFHAAMDQARTQYPQLAHKGYHLGVFRDDDEGGRIDIDPVVRPKTIRQVEQIGAYTRAVGGAYGFRTGNGYFPPHVRD